jgi:hypothetical protein
MSEQLVNINKGLIVGQGPGNGVQGFRLLCRKKLKACDRLEGGVLVCDGHCGEVPRPWNSWTGVFCVSRELVMSKQVGGERMWLIGKDRDVRGHDL